VLLLVVSFVQHVVVFCKCEIFPNRSTNECHPFRRGLNPPHRVKSINMSTFTQDEVDFMKAHGNQVKFELIDSKLMMMFAFR